MKIVACYIRRSKGEKDQAKQRREISRWLKSNRINRKSVRWYVDKATGKRRQPKLDALQGDILDGKVRAVAVWHLERLSLSTRDRLNLLIDWCDQLLRVVSVGQQIDVKPGDCKLIGSVVRGVTEVLPETWRELTKVGLATARARGRLGGRPQVAADDPSVLQVKKLQKNSKLSIDDICKQLKISRSTYYRYVGL
jgi:DNA invertase Pin-like site-specific DNA recombinase